MFALYRSVCAHGERLFSHGCHVEIPDDEFKAFKAKLVKCVNSYLSSDESIGEERLLEAMGFPAEWKKITRYKL